MIGANARCHLQFGRQRAEAPVHVVGAVLAVLPESLKDVYQCYIQRQVSALVERFDAAWVRLRLQTIL